MVKYIIIPVLGVNLPEIRKLFGGIVWEEQDVMSLPPHITFAYGVDTLSRNDYDHVLSALSLIPKTIELDGPAWSPNPRLAWMSVFDMELERAMREARTRMLDEHFSQTSFRGYIIAPSCSGKTTFAKGNGKVLDVDAVYSNGPQDFRDERSFHRVNRDWASLDKLTRKQIIVEVRSNPLVINKVLLVHSLAEAIACGAKPPMNIVSIVPPMDVFLHRVKTRKCGKYGMGIALMNYGTVVLDSIAGQVHSDFNQYVSEWIDGLPFPTPMRHRDFQMHVTVGKAAEGQPNYRDVIPNVTTGIKYTLGDPVLVDSGVDNLGRKFKSFTILPKSMKYN
jgi:2'-5' RNA ligase